MKADKRRALVLNTGKTAGCFFLPFYGIGTGNCETKEGERVIYPFPRSSEGKKRIFLISGEIQNLGSRNIK